MKCQSCGMPLNRDPLGGGSESNGTKSITYCSYCYSQGSFTDPKITCEQMIVKVNSKLKEMKIPQPLRWFFYRNIPKLDRWK